MNSDFFWIQDDVSLPRVLDVSGEKIQDDVQHEPKTKIFYCSDLSLVCCEVGALRSITGRLTQLLMTPLSMTKVWGSIPGPVKWDTVSPTAGRRCVVFSELSCSSVMPRRWIPAPSARCTAFCREYNEDLILKDSVSAAEKTLSPEETS